MKINFNTIKQYNNSIFFIKTKEKPFLNNKKSQLSNDIFEKSSEISFKASIKGECARSNFKIKQIKNLRCPACLQVMLSDFQQEIFVKKASQKTGEDLVDFLEFYEDERNITHDYKKGVKRTLFRPSMQEVVNIIKKLAKEHPTLTLDELIAYDVQTHKDNLIPVQMSIINELRRYVNFNTSENEKKIYHKVFDEYTKRITGKSQKKFRRKDFIQELTLVSLNKTNLKNIIKIVEKIPISQNNPDAFFIKYGEKGATREEIAKALIYQTTPTTEHLSPRVKGGENNISNYICDCFYCNSQKGDLSFYEWQKKIPEFDKRIEEYLHRVEEEIKMRNLDRIYYGYIKNVKETIERLSMGEIKLKGF